MPNLECLQIDCHELQKCLLGNNVKYQMRSLKELSLVPVDSSNILQVLCIIPNLEKFEIFGFDDLFEESLVRCLGTLLQLKELSLNLLYIEDLGFEREPVLQRIELLSLSYCHNLIKLAPPSISLTYLTYLEVQFCDGLKRLMASSTAKSLVQLKTMKVINCDEIKEIVTNEGNEEDKVIKIVFSKLITIQLVGLKNLTSFCSFEKCELKFPSLEILIVRECPMMKTFSESPASAPKLQNILAAEGEEVAKWQSEGDLNATWQKVFNDEVSFTYTERLDLFNHIDILESLWQHKVLVQENSFRNLKTLMVYGCHSIMHVIPSHLISCFENLEELHVGNCSAAQVIFNINDEIRETKASGITRLKSLSLNDLPKLEHVWDKDPEGIIGLQLLKYMHVNGCGHLKSLFPASVAKDLTRLEELQVKKCGELVEIISEDEEAKEGETKMFVFSCLTSLTLKTFPGLKYLYLKLDAFGCELVTLKFQENHPEEQALIQIHQKVIQIPSFKKLSFGIGDTEVTWDRESGRLQFDSLERFNEVLDSTAPLCKFLDTLPTIEKLMFSRGSFEEMFSAERPNADYNRILLHLKGLQLRWMDNLQTLQVYHCNSLEHYLIPGTVSFSNLTHLEVIHCISLLYLFTSSTAKSLARLKRMKIKWCESLKEIVSTEGDDESRQDEQIIFEQLQVLYLEQLQQLNCFYPGNRTLRFPCLEQVYVIDCSSMKTFSAVNKIDHSTNWFSAEDATPQLECDLNSAAHRTFLEKISESVESVSYLELGDRPDLQEIWHSSQSIQKLCFGDLASLIVDGCQFLSDVLPFYLLPFLTKLETLEVRNCDYVETIFDVKCITQDRVLTTTEPVSFPLPFPLKNLTLSSLPNLENVWNEDPHGILSMQLLQQVYVEKCKCLTIVFPASVAEDLVKLENLVVQHCEGLITIVAEDNADPKGTNLDLTFPSMVSMTLWDLPKLKYFYYFSLQCDMWKTYTHLEPQTQNQVCIEKFTPNLEHLTLGENELKMIWHGEFQRNLFHKLKVLIFLNFDVEFNAFAYGFLQQVPNIEKLEVSCSSLKKIFCSQSPSVDYTGVLSQLKVLSLETLPQLETIGLQNILNESFLRNLETLDVSNCSGLRNIAPSPVGFPNLTSLFVFECHQLENLFTSSTAKSLAQLKIMEIKICESIEEIVSMEEGGSQEDEIIFGKLFYLKLQSLPNLTSFYRGNLCFPSLVQLSIINCHNMENLCSGTISADKLLGVKFKNKSDAIPLEYDLNSTIRKALHATAFDYLSSSSSDTIPWEIDLNSSTRKALHETAFDYLSSSSSDTDEDSEYGED